MPLPSEGATWPPQHQGRREVDRYSAMYASRSPGCSPHAAFEADPDMGSPNTSNPTDSKRVRGGIAGDIASIAAAHVIGESIGLTVDEGAGTAELVAATEDRLRDHAKALNSVLLEGSELAAVHGDAFYRVAANPALRPMPYATVIDTTRTIPTFRDGVLAAAIFCTEIAVEGDRIWRYLERRSNTERVIENALYVGSSSSLGKRVALDSMEETTGLEDTYSYPEGVERMVWHAPNLRPNRRHPQLPFGRSDLQGSESLVAAFDVTLTALIRGVRLSAPTIVVPEGALEMVAGGQGAFFDERRELYTTLDIPPDSGITLTQAAIRANEHLETLRFLAGKIADNAGLSLQTVGLGDYGTATSGTALRLHLERTIATTTAKRRYLEPVVADIGRALLQLDRAVFGAPVAPVTPNVIWQPVISDSTLEKAQELEILVRAKAISIETAVREANPTLADADVQAEVARILAENGLTADLTPSVDPQAPLNGF